MVGGKAKWSSKGWIINKLESEVVVLFEQVVIDLKHGPKVSVYRVGCDPWAVSGTGGVAIQDCYVLPVDRVMAVPGVLCQCRVHTNTQLHCLVVLLQLLVELSSCLSYRSG